MLTIADVMTRTVQRLDRTQTVAEAIVQMQTHGLRSLIVNRLAADQPYGIVTERDIVYKVFAQGLDPNQIQVQDIMRQPCISLEPQLTLREAALMMSNSGIQRAPVIQEGELLGIISVTDLVMKGYVGSLLP
ncbi:MAG: CBS domain-containing protein [Leptolyngbya sp. SIO1D8]|nr:CBS domain-containing protein [Leptolyngbya sp. SIO1D8]